MKRPHFINKFPKALSADVCEEAIRLFDQKIEDAEHVDDEFRNDYSLFIDDYDSFVDIQLAINNTLEKYYSEVFTENSLEYSHTICRPFKLQKSTAGGGFYDWHTEQGASETSSTRFGVWMIYLNTVEKGGCTEFKWFEHSVKPEQGTLLIWPAAYTHVHRAAPDLEQDKYIATGWFSYGKGTKHHRIREENSRN